MTGAGTVSGALPLVLPCRIQAAIFLGSTKEEGVERLQTTSAFRSPLSVHRRMSAELEEGSDTQGRKHPLIYSKTSTRSKESLAVVIAKRKQPQASQSPAAPHQAGLSTPGGRACPTGLAPICPAPNSWGQLSCVSSICGAAGHGHTQQELSFSTGAPGFFKTLFVSLCLSL